MRGVTIAVLAAALAAGCGGSAGKDGKTITVAGSTAFAPVVEKLAKAYQARNPDVKIDVHALGSIVGIKSTNEGSCDIGIADLVELPATAAQLKPVAVSRDGIAVVVHPSNPVKTLSKAQIAGIFSGAIRNWKEVGGPDHEITAITREPSSGTRASFEKILDLKGKIPNTMQTQNSNGSCRTAVASDPHAVSYVSFVLVDASVRALAVEGTEATIENVKSGSYPIAATDFLLTKGDPKPAAKAFMDFVLSPEGQKLIQDAGLIPVK